MAQIVTHLKDVFKNWIEESVSAKSVAGDRCLATEWALATKALFKSRTSSTTTVAGRVGAWATTVLSGAEEGIELQALMEELDIVGAGDAVTAIPSTNLFQLEDGPMAFHGDNAAAHTAGGSSEAYVTSYGAEH